MAEWGKWVAIIGGVIAFIGQFGNLAAFWLPAIGGILAVIGGFAK